jgi:hypothetical protein
MALVAIAASGAGPAKGSRLPAHGLITGVYAGEALPGGRPCYIKQSDKAVWLSLGTATATDDSNRVDGWTAGTYPLGVVVTLITVPIHIGGHNATDAQVGKRLYVSTTKGVLADTTAHAGQKPCAVAYTNTAILTAGPVF